MKYTKAQINTYLDYLTEWVANYNGDEAIANDIIDRKAWHEVEEMMAKGDDELDVQIKDENS